MAVLSLAQLLVFSSENVVITLLYNYDDHLMLPISVLQDKGRASAN